MNLAVDAAHGGSQSSLDRSEGESDVGSSRPARRTARVLIVEDNADDAKLMVHTIGQSDITISAVQVVETKPAFIEALAAFRPDVILADYTLPSFTGAEALTIALQALPHVPFIFVTGTLGEERAVELLHQGAADYVLKDRSARLGPAISRALDEAAMRAEREIQARQLEQANTALTQSNNELEQFAYIASHDLSAPLHTVAGFVQLLAQRYQGKLDAQADEFLRLTDEPTSAPVPKKKEK
ncbi:MAG: response regulator, partial [Gemmatimonadota bacterium]